MSRKYETDSDLYDVALSLYENMDLGRIRNEMVGRPDDIDGNEVTLLAQHNSHIVPDSYILLDRRTLRTTIPPVRFRLMGDHLVAVVTRWSATPNVFNNPPAHWLNCIILIYTWEGKSNLLPIDQIVTSDYDIFSKVIWCDHHGRVE